MINLYQKPTEKNPTVGMTFEFFKSMELGRQYEKYEDLPTAMYYLTQAKHDLLISNLEAFWMFCDKVIDEQDQTIVESIKTLRDTVNDSLDNKEKYYERLADIKEKANFMRTLVSAVPEYNGRKDTAIMIAASIQKFCREELDEYEKNKDKE